jgi:ribosomal subunit interface protein
MQHYLTIAHATRSQRERIRQLVKQSIARLDKVLNNRSSAALLHVVVDENRVRKLYRALAILNVPRGTLATEEERHDVTEAVREVFEEIERQLRRHLDKLARSHTYKRKARREQLRRRKVQAV